jgi:sugar phosphate isomerase/epimerase
MTATAACAGSARAAEARDEDDEPAGVEPFVYGLNTSTLQGFKLPIVEEVKLASAVGYGGVEPWIRELEQHEKDGGSLEDLGKQIRDLGLVVPSAIGFFEWAVDDADRRKKALEDARRAMEKVKAIGGTRIAAPASGATDVEGIDLRRLAERYRAVLDLGDEIGVVPEVEVWGFSKTLTRLGDAVFVAIESGHPSACILPDVYHLYKGGSNLGGIRLLSGKAIPVFHMNDYPAQPPRETITDAHRVYPGDGVAPLGDLMRDLRDIGFDGMLSLELFNREYWKQAPEAVARTGLKKMKAVVRKALA